MPTYYFHLRNGSDILLDPEGRDLPNLNGIKHVALVEARALLSQEVLNGRINLGQRLDIEDDSGRIVHSLPFVEAVEIVEFRSHSR